MKIMKRIIYSLLLILVIGYGAIIVFLKVKEADFVFNPDFTGVKYAPPPKYLGLRYFEKDLKTSDGLTLKAWEIAPDPRKDKNTWILFFRGNAGTISDTILGYPQRFSELSKLGFTLFTFDYRGFGISEGEPTEEGIYLDAQTAYEYLMNEKGISPENIIIYGYSLGSGVATKIARDNYCKGLILESAFKSIPAMGEEMYPFIPINMIATIAFDSYSRIDKINVPKLFLHATDDRLIPISHGKALYEKAPPPKKFVEFEGGHINGPIISRDLLYPAIDKWYMEIK